MVNSQAQLTGMNGKSGFTVDKVSRNDTLNGVSGARGKADDGNRPDRLLGLLKGEPPQFRSKETPPPEAEMLTKPQAAAMLNVSVRTVDRLVTRGDIPRVILGRRCVRFPQKALRAWLESKTRFRK